MDKSMLRDKDKRVLKLIVEEYLDLGKPVSSGILFQKKALAGSPATLRNVMARLEEKGFLSQPHTSAGRIPTDKGLRFYVNDLLEEMFFPVEETGLLPEQMTAIRGDFDSLLIQVSTVLAENSGNLGFVLSPRITQMQFRNLRFIKISENKVMVILVTPFQMVLTQIAETSTLFTQTELDQAAQYINLNFRGKTLIAVRDFLLQELPKHKLRYEDLIAKLAVLVRTYVRQEESENRIFIQGTSKLLDKSELFDMGKLRVLFQKFEQKANLARLLSDFISLDRVKVLIGSEVDFPDIQDCSLILSHYGYSHQVLGSLGIIGPKRIPYEKIIPLVDCVAKRLSRAITSPDHEVLI
jgi:heat-inducible transcriptional repressor